MFSLTVSASIFLPNFSSELVVFMLLIYDKMRDSMLVTTKGNTVAVPGCCPQVAATCGLAQAVNLSLAFSASEAIRGLRAVSEVSTGG